MSCLCAIHVIIPDPDYRASYRTRSSTELKTFCPTNWNTAIRHFESWRYQVILHNFRERSYTIKGTKTDYLIGANCITWCYTFTPSAKTPFTTRHSSTTWTDALKDEPPGSSTVAAATSLKYLRNLETSVFPTCCLRVYFFSLEMDRFLFFFRYNFVEQSRIFYFENPLNGRKM